MRLTFRWDEASLAWIDGLTTRMVQAFRTGGAVAMSSAGQRAVASARGKMPVFEGDAQRSLAYSRMMQGGGAVLVIGFQDGTNWVPGEEGVGWRHAPYHYPWGKERSQLNEPAEKHKVWLFNPATGQSTANRRKLVRWLKAQGADLPDAPTAEHWNKSDRPDMPPYVWVDPGETASDYLGHLIAQNGDPLVSWIVEGLIAPIRGAWEA